uniref:Dolichyl-diphosphooligosaccharide--protein glycosyltransferase subunit DAD1 n=1 Tax=Eubosmina coregoni TaxID=186181 RepID=A0A4Y7LMJ1_9CRUS|nr:EOG090X0KAT [Eubosmina coregoni]SVE70200.1 EOG090X0KAT [Eubosmina coregoni]
MAASISTVVVKFYEDYAKSTSTKLKLVDAYLLYILLTGVVQFLYCCLVGTFPFNSFLSGFISCVGSFVLAACLRLQVNPANKGQFEIITKEIGFLTFLIINVVFHLREVIFVLITTQI